MRGWLSTLLLVLTLPSSFSIAQESSQLSPFDKYLAGVRTRRPEGALVRVATVCGVNLKTATVRTAERPGDTWKLVQGLAHARDDQATDLFSTAEVWHAGQRVLLEEWNMDSEAGDEIRTIFCLVDREVKYGERIEWSSPPEANASVWAYEVRWNVEQGKLFKSILERFVNEHEEPDSKPKLGSDAPTVFGVIPEIRTWADLKLPDEMLR